MNKFKYLCFFLLFSLSVLAQQKQVATSIDTTRNKIGAQFNLTLKTTVDANAAVVFPKQKTFGKMEVIRSYVVDTLKNGNRIELVKRYGLAQFDSGRYTIPRLKILINKIPAFSDSVIVAVTNVKVDTLKQKLYDIKDIVKADSPSINWWIYVLILIAIAGIGLLIYKIVKKSQLKKAKLEIFKTPIEKATTLLQQLEKKELWQKGEIKNYYSELTDIARNYIEEAIKIPAMESTTSELIAGLRMAAVKNNMSLSQETVENLERVLKQADLVKFAKEKPLDYEIAEDRKKIEKTIVTLDQSIPEVSEDEALMNELQKQRLLRKQKTKRAVITVGAVVFLLFSTALFFVVTKGFDFVKDNLLGHPTKELLEGEWIASDYGNPEISISTPKVLKRIETSKMLSEETAALLKEMQTFTYGTIYEAFNITISTTTYKAEQQIDLKAVQELQIQTLEQQGMRNILLRPEEFQTRGGISGTKISGTLVQKDKRNNKDRKMYYEALLFGQQNGLQQIVIMHEDGDNYGKEIAKRVLNSVELKQVSQ